MEPKRMKHPEHGFTHVYDAGQEEQIRAHGWVEESEYFVGSKEALEIAKRQEMDRLWSDYDPGAPVSYPVSLSPEPVKRRITRKTKS